MNSPALKPIRIYLATIIAAGCPMTARAASIDIATLPLDSATGARVISQSGNTYYTTAKVSNQHGASTTAGWDTVLINAPGGTVVIDSADLECLDQRSGAGSGGNTIHIAAAAKVTIQNCTLHSVGNLINVINSTAARCDLTVRNVAGYALDAMQPGATKGRFLVFPYSRNVVVEHCYMEGTGGMFFQKRDPNTPSSATNTFTFRYNRARNIDGRTLDTPANASTNTPAVYHPYENHQTRNFFQFLDIPDLQAVDISFNEVINEPYNSYVGDNFSLLHAAGTPASHIDIHDNFIYGAYTGVPDSYLDPDGGTAHYFGGGIICDGGTGIVATAGTGQISVRWGAVSGVIQYNVQRAPSLSDGSSGAYATVKTLAPGTLSWVDTGKTNGTKYWYQLSTVVPDTSAGKPPGATKIITSRESSATPSTTPAPEPEVSSYADIHDNQVVGTNNYGIAVESGHHVYVYGNTLLNSGKLPDGVTDIYDSNTGQTIWNWQRDPVDLFSDIQFGARTGTPYETNYVSWVDTNFYTDGSGATINGANRLGNTYFPSVNDANRIYAQYTAVPGISGLPTFDDERNQFLGWWDKLAANNLQLGVINGEVVYEAERLPVAATSPSTAVSDGTLAGVRDDRANGSYWSLLNSTATGQYVGYYVRIPKARKYRVVVQVKTNSSRGDVQLSIADTVGGPYTACGTAQNCRTGSVFEERTLGDVKFATDGTKVFQFAVVNTAGTIGIDYIKLIPLDGVYETEYMQSTASAGATAYLDDPDPQLSNGLATHFVGVNSGDSVVYTVPNVAADSAPGYRVYVGYKAYTNRGAFKIEAAKIDPVSGIGTYGSVGPVSTYDTYLSHSAYPEIEVTTSSTYWKPSTTTDKAFRFTVSPGGGGGLDLMIDYIRLEPQ